MPPWRNGLTTPRLRGMVVAMFHTSYLFASLVWGSVGVGYFIYGRKQQSFSAIAGGILMVVVAYAISSAVLMTLVCLGTVAAVYGLVKRGY
jgi:hypothetical protein